MNTKLVEQNIIREFNHFKNVTGEAYSIKFKWNNQERWTDDEGSVHVRYSYVFVRTSIKRYSQSHKKHSLRLNNLCEKLENKYNVQIIIK